VTGSEPQHILVATSEILGARRAGPAVRAWHFAAALAADPVGHNVTLAATPGDGSVMSPGFTVTSSDKPTLEGLATRNDVVIVQGDVLTRVPALAMSDAVVIADLYDPFQLEALEQTSAFERDHRRRAIWAAGHAIDDLLRRGDLFLCAGGRQRDFWIGALSGAGRVNEATHLASPDFRRFLLDVPFGVEDEPPHSGPALRNIVTGIGSSDVILWWGGGIYAWLDTGTLLEAVGRLVAEHPEVRLVFAGTRHPNPDVGVTPAASEAQAHAARLGLTGRHVFFLPWIAYEDRGSYLLEADIVVSTHFDQLETSFSYRTRILDALWAARPVVTTGGDALGEVVAASGAGIVVPPRNVDALAAALTDLVEDAARRARCGAAAGRLGCQQRWSTVIAPLLQFCRAPAAAPDRLDPLIGPMLAKPGSGPRPASFPTRLRRLIGRVADRVSSRARG
jgi:glycosyltransferase involved in cell wall biosynthesis